MRKPVRGESIALPAEAEDTSAGDVPGVVIRAGRGLYIVHTDSGRVIPCKLRGNLKKNLTYPESASRAHRVEKVKKKRETDPMAVGDRVDASIDGIGTLSVRIQDAAT